MQLCYQDNITLVTKHINISYLHFYLGYTLFAIQIYICPYTKEPDIMELIDPLLMEHGAVICLDIANLVTQEEMPSRYPNDAVLITQEETMMKV